MVTVRESWLAQPVEEPIDPDLPIYDPHHHFWDTSDVRYLLHDLLQDTGQGPNIVSSVFIECESMYRKAGPEEMRPVGETEFVQGIAAQSASGGYGPTVVAGGIVGFADLTLGSAVGRVLEAQAAASPNRFRGIRHRAAWDASIAVSTSQVSGPGLFLDEKFREGLACLQTLGVTFDAWVYHPQLADLADVARAFPDVTLIMNHVGGLLGVGPYAGQREEVFQEWKNPIAEVAAQPNVVVKLGGLGMPRCGFGWHERDMPPTSTELAETTGPYYLHCIEQFGVDRCMFESNFPVDKASYSYGVMWNSFKRIAQAFSAAERAALFHDTAARVYRIGESSSGIQTPAVA